MIDAIVLDIEGTTSSLSYVHDHLFPYSRQRIPEWIRKPDPEVVRLVEEVRALAGCPEATLEQITALLQDWVDADRKPPPLKSLQGLIWEAGFVKGELTAHLYPDVPEVLRAWQVRGIKLYVYSSGSVLAQRLWFGHTPYGDLTDCLSGYFDTRSAGPKREPASYLTITKVIGTRPGRTLFLSDSQEELDAARQAHWQTVQVLRPEDGATAAPGHLQVTNLQQIVIEGLGLTTKAAHG